MPKKVIDPAPIIKDLADRCLKAKGLECSVLGSVIDMLKAAPAMDAKEVVRCGACKDWLEIEETGGAGYCHHPCWMIAGVEPPIVQFADFCSYGERKDNVL